MKSVRRRLGPAACQFAVTLLVGWLLFAILGARDHLIPIWPLTALQLALLLGIQPDTRVRYSQLAGVVLGKLLAFELVGIPFSLAAPLSIIQAAEVAAVGAALSSRIRRFEDLRRVGNVVRFFIVVLMGSSATAVISSIPIAILIKGSAVQTWKIVMPSDALGFMILFPPALYVLSGELFHRRLSGSAWTQRAASLVVFVAVAVGIFDEKSMPFLFLAFPPLLFVSFAMEVEGAVFAIPLLAVIARVATASGSGPIWLNPSLPMAHRIFALQLFLGTASLKALAVGAVLAERRSADRSANQARMIYETLLENADDMIILSSLDSSWRFVSPAVKRITGWTPEEYLAQGPLDVVYPDDRDLARTILGSIAGGKPHHTFRFRAMCKGGGYAWVESSLRGIHLPGEIGTSGYVATVRDISRLKLAEESWIEERADLARRNRDLAEQALRDELTGIPNRRAFNRVLDLELTRMSRMEQSAALLMIDLDQFKKFNDRYGHPAGDECLRAVAEQLLRCASRPSDFVARLGGEEFAALLPSTDGPGALVVAENMRRAIEEGGIAHVDGIGGRVTVSVGIAIWLPHEAGDGPHLIQCADRALYQSKKLGRNRVTTYQDSMPALAPENAASLV